MSTVRMPAVAGQFYPDEPKLLQQQVNRWMEIPADSAERPDPLALIVPHAGYLFSGLVAGCAYRQLRAQTFETVVMVGLSHRYRFEGAAIYGEGIFRTPLGDVGIDTEMASAIMRQGQVHHLPQAHEDEHSLEVQLPFLQQTFTSFKIVPILVNDDSISNISSLAAAISEAMVGRSALLIGSTDLCHYPTYSEAVAADRVTIDALSAYDSDYLRTTISTYMSQHPTPNLHCMICSTAAVYVTLEASKLLGGKQLKILLANNSGDAPQGGHDQVVGYMSGAIYS